MTEREHISMIVERSQKAQQAFEAFSQEQVDAIVRAAGLAVYENAVLLAKMAVEETGMGILEDKIQKNQGKAKTIWNSLKGKRSVGIIERDNRTGIVKVAKPKGVIAAVTPTTNPIVTPMCNAMFALKGRNSIIVAPHPRAKGCSAYTVKLMNEAISKLGAPEHLIQVIWEPTDQMVDAIRHVMGSKQYARIIAIGGGTILDIAKLLVFGSGVSTDTIFKSGAALPKRSSLIAVPTTCGTGSEVTDLSIVSFLAKETKLGLGLAAMRPDEAVLIPAMLETMPYDVFAASSVDALIHSMESYLSPKANAFSKAMSVGAMELILDGYQELQAAGTSMTLPESLDAYLTASTMAGVAFANAGVGMVHALAYPIGARYHVPHGKANCMMFQAVFNAYRNKGVDLSAMEDILARLLDCDIQQAWGQLFQLTEQIAGAPALRALGVDEGICGDLAASVVQTQQRLLINSPVSIDEEGIRCIYYSCL